MKMKRRLHILLTAFCLILLGQAGSRVYAQNPKTIEVGPHAGITSYVGELNSWRHLDQWTWKEFNQFSYDWGVLARFNYNTRWSFRLDYTHGRFRASDPIAAWRPEAELNFKSTVNDLSLMVEFNFLDYYTGHIKNTISPYIFAGVSGMVYHVQPFTGIDSLDVMYFNDLKQGANDADVFNVSDTLKPFFQRNMALSIPFGIGCKMSLSKHLAATVEWRMHYTLTDYLDGVHGNYAEIHSTAKDYDFTDPTGHFEAGYQRGNSQTNDWFGMINVSLTWKFVIPNNSACKMNVE